MLTNLLNSPSNESPSNSIGDGKFLGVNKEPIERGTRQSERTTTTSWRCATINEVRVG